MLVFAVIVMAVMGAAFGILLGIAGKKFYVEVDPRVAAIRACLPGANCGGCGFPGCDGFADAVVAGKAAPNACKAGGPSVSTRIGDVMGVAVATAGDREIARILCAGASTCGDRAEYRGVPSCRAAGLAGGGFKNCEYGCLGLGDCVRACPFGAIVMLPSGVPDVLEEKCVGCGSCVKACPRHIIELVPESKDICVGCRSAAAGPVTRKTCKLGCIACRQCVKVCPEGAMSVENNLAKVDLSKCKSCGLCSAKCPTGAKCDVHALARKRAAS